MVVVGNIVVSASQLLASQLDVVAQVIGGLLVLVVCGAIWWHRRQRAANKPGMASWWFVGLSFLVALLAVGAGSYGLGLHFATEKSATSQGDEKATGATTTALPAALRRQPYRMTDNALPADQQDIVRVSDGAHIPSDPKNTDFKIYITWIEAGNKPDPKEATLAPVYAARSPSDADKEIPIVDQIYDFIRDNSESLPQRGQELLQKWFMVMGDADQIASYKAELDKFAYEFMRVNDKILAMARQSGPYCLNDLCLIVSDATKNNFDLINSIGRFENALDSLSPVVDREKYTKNYLTIKKDADINEIVTRSHFSEIVAPYIEPPNRLLAAYRIWVSWVQRLLLERRDQLSIASRR